MLVSLGCYNKYHRWGGLNDRNLFFTILEAGILRSRASRVGFWEEIPPWLADSLLNVVSSHGLSFVACFSSTLLISLPILLD